MILTQEIADYFSFESVKGYEPANIMKNEANHDLYKNGINFARQKKKK